MFSAPACSGRQGELLVMQRDMSRLWGRMRRVLCHVTGADGTALSPEGLQQCGLRAPEALPLTAGWTRITPRRTLGLDLPVCKMGQTTVPTSGGRSKATVMTAASVVGGRVHASFLGPLEPGRPWSCGFPQQAHTEVFRRQHTFLHESPHQGHSSSSQR